MPAARRWIGAAPPSSPLAARARGGAAPLSFAQERLWFLDRLGHERSLYSVARVYDLSGPLSPTVLQSAWSEVVRRHEVLRSKFPMEAGQPVQIAVPAAPLPLPVVDLGGLEAGRREEAAGNLAAREVDRPFDLERGPLLRLLLLRLDTRRHWLVVGFHHIVCDARSLELLLQELASLYASRLAGTDAPLSKVELQYADFAHWEVERAEELDVHLPYWRERLMGLTELRLPFDRPRPALQSFRGARHLMPLGVDLERVGVLARELRATRFTLLLAAFASFLRRMTGQEDLPVGSPFTGRTCPGTERMIGFFVQTLVLRIDAAGDPGFAELVRRVFVTVAEAQAHQDLPFDRLVRALRPERTLSHNPLFQVMFAVVPASAKGLALPGLTARRIPIAAGMARFDLTLEILEDEVEEGAAVAIEHNPELFDPPTIQRLAGGFRRLLAACLDDPQRPLSELPLLDVAERQQMLVEWNDGGVEAEDTCLPDLFLKQAERTPEAEALIAGEERITYRDLARRAQGLAFRLRALGVGPEVPVGIFSERSAGMVVGLLGTLIAGGAYVPLDPEYPEERLAFLLEDAALPLILAQSGLLARLPAGAARVVDLEDALAAGGAETEPLPPASTAADNLAYAIYTSGSTGRPKGVAVTHRSAVARMRWARQAFPREDLAGVLASTSICFDVSVFELFAPLSWGGKVILSRNVLDLPRLAARDEVVTLCTVPSALGELVDAGPLPASVRTVNLAGEALRRALVERLFENPGVARVLNLYGPSEDTTYSTLGVAAAGSQGEPAIGRPLPGTRAYVLDSRLALMPRGAVGELYLGGVGQARGYLGRPELTAERFVPDPFSSRPGQRLYRTGDLARYRADGELEYLGRTDHQVKLRGFRIELGEIESALSGIAGVREAVVVVCEAPAGMSLAAFYVAGSGAAPTAEALRTALRARLPEYMVPGRFVQLAALPRTPNGKIARAALAAIPGARETAGRRPVSPLEELIAEVWSAVLGHGAIGAEEDFFELGGHSLLATRVLARLRECLGIEVGVRQIFELRTVAELAAWIERERWRGSRPAPPLLKPAVRGPRLPLSFAQERLWFLDRLEPASELYNLPVAWRLEGELSVPVLEAALAAVVRRHEALRTVFDDASGMPTQVVLPAVPAPLPVVDLRGLPEGARASEARRLVLAEGRMPFDLERGPLQRQRLLATGAREHVLILGMHHIVADGWSIEALWAELAELYEAALGGRPASLPDLPVQYPDYAVWQREWLSNDVLQSLLRHWRDRLAGAATLDLPIDRPRPAVRSVRGGLVRFELPAATARSLAKLGHRTGTTRFMVLLAAFQTLLHRLSGEEDVVLGTPVAGRDRVELEPLIGFFVNTLALRCRLSGSLPFADLLARVREVTLQAYAHQDLPFERLVEELQPVRDLARTPLFQAMFVFQNTPRAAREMPGLSRTRLPIDTGVAKLDLSLALSEEGPAGALPGSLEFSRDLFDAATIERMAVHLQVLLEGIAADPGLPLSHLPLLTEAEQQHLLREWNDPRPAAPEDLCLHTLFEEQVRRTPDAVAVLSAAGRLTYRELEERSRRLAGHLIARGVGPEVVVGLRLERGPEALVAMLAILKAGGAYLPLDPAYPWERLAWMLEDSGAPLLLTETDRLGRMGEVSASIFCLDRDLEPIAGSAGVPALPGSPAYCMYTSGSTGRSKGVLVEHRSAAWYARTAARNYGIGPADRVLQFASISFDLSVEEIFPALSRGAALVLGTRELQLSTSAFLDACRAAAVTVVSLPTAYWHELCAEVEADPSAVPGSLRLVILGGEKASAERAATWLRSAPGIALVNTYGPTETTVVATLQRLDAAVPGEIPLGRPIPGARVHVVDRGLHLLPAGVPGELCIGGAGVARGYLGRPDLTAERFVPDPFSQSPGARLYRTGDRARLRPGGELEFLGRLDDQLKVRGFRIEPREIETVLRRQTGVREAAVLAWEDGTGDRRLAAYVAPAGLSAVELRRGLARELPDFMVPAAFVLLDALPMSPNGKLDRKALPVPRLSRQETACRPPRTPLEEVLAGIWTEVLGVDCVGLDDSFFELGGHSLKAAQVVARLRSALGMELPLRSLFEAPRLEDLARRAEASLGPRHSAPALAPVPRDRQLPLSFAQERLWFLDRLDPDSPVYNLPVAWRLQGDLSMPALEAAIAGVARRHEALRTVFDDAPGGPVQVVLPAAAAPLPVVDLRGLPEGLRAAEADRLAVAEGRRPFDLRRGPLLRRMLLATGEREHVLVLGLHHIVADGWSMGALWTELALLYGGESLPDLPVQYPDYAVWQREWLRGEALETLLDHWRERLAGAATLDLPTDRPRSAVRSQRGGIVRFGVPAAVAQALATLGRGTGTTRFMVLLAAFQTLLYRLTGEEDVVVGTPVAGRDRVELEPLIGFFVNTLALRCRLSGRLSAGELLARVREATLQAFAHQDLPFERLVDELQPSRNLAQTPLFQAMFVFQNTPASAPSMPGLSLVQLPVETGVSRLDLTLVMTEAGGELGGLIEYDSGLFDRATVRRLAGHLSALLAALAADAGRPLAALPLLSESERHQLAVEWNDAATGVPEAPGEVTRLDRMLAAQARRTPAATAVRCAGREWSYRELDEWSGRLAGRLRRLGVGPETRVGVCLERSPELIAALVGILKAGGAYVPLDPAHPEERTAYLVADSGAALVVTDERLARRLPAGVPALRIDAGFDEDTGAEPALCGASLAYVIHTSGSTGEPKGVMVSHRSAANLSRAFCNALDLAPGDRFLMMPSVSFDASVGDIFPALLSGASLVLHPNPGELSGRELQALCESEAITILDIPAAFWQTWVEDMERRQVRAALPALRKVIVGGESLPLDRLGSWARITDGRTALMGPYGPTEATVCSTFFTLAGSAGSLPAGLSKLPIGRPLANLRVHLLDRGLQPVPVGIPGEVYIGGEGLARGYLDRPGSTAEKFVPDPLGLEPGARLYRSGDLACHLPAGDLLFLGRVDHQIKIRGFRVEPGEIEAALLRHPRVRQAVVAARRDGRGQGSLVAWVVPDGHGPLLPGDLRGFLKDRLPAHAVPSAFVCLDELPLNPHGKIDHKALPAPDRGAPGAGELALRTPTEESLARIWAELLGIGAVRVDDDFFELGGHSLLAVQLATRIRESFAVELPLRAIFEHPTLAGLAELLEDAPREESEDERLERLLGRVRQLSADEVEELLAGP